MIYKLIMGAMVGALIGICSTLALGQQDGDKVGDWERCMLGRATQALPFRNLVEAINEAHEKCAAIFPEFKSPLEMAASFEQIIKLSMATEDGLNGQAGIDVPGSAPECGKAPKGDGAESEEDSFGAGDGPPEVREVLRRYQARTHRLRGVQIGRKPQSK